LKVKLPNWLSAPPSAPPLLTAWTLICCGPVCVIFASSVSLSTPPMPAVIFSRFGPAGVIVRLATPPRPPAPASAANDTKIVTFT
jgi:hypothetical protein